MIDLRHNYPAVAAQVDLLRAALRSQSEGLHIDHLQLPAWAGRTQTCHQLGEWLGAQSSQEVVLCAGGNHALLVAVLALGLQGKTVVTDPFTYGAFLALGAQLGVRIVSCPGDEKGMLPAALASLCQQEPVAAVYLQPTIHNPTGITMPLSRREEIALVLERADVQLIEDDAYRFLHEDPPPYLACLVPNRATSIYSFSKPFCPLLKVSCLTIPAAAKSSFETAIRLTSSGASSLLVDVAHKIATEGLLDELIRQKQHEAAKRQSLAQQIFLDHEWNGHPTAFHGWLRLPYDLKSDDVRSVMKSKGVDVCSGTEFAAPGESGHAWLRCSLGAEHDPARLAAGLEGLKGEIELRQFGPESDTATKRDSSLESSLCTPS